MARTQYDDWADQVGRPLIADEPTPRNRLKWAAMDVLGGLVFHGPSVVTWALVLAALGWLMGMDMSQSPAGWIVLALGAFVTDYEEPTCWPSWWRLGIAAVGMGAAAWWMSRALF